MQRRFGQVLIPGLAALALVSGCSGGSGDDGGGRGGGGREGGPDGGVAPNPYVLSPLKNPDGTKPGLGPVTSDADKAAARRLIDQLLTKGRGPRTGYERDEFGYAWMDTADGVPLARNGCDTRNDLLKRDGRRLRFRSGSDCVVVSMTLRDPYTGKTIEWRKQKATEVQIDHVVPLSYSWQMGSSRWPKSKREQLANDALNLIPVEGRANSAKGDSGPASWLPPSKQIRCAYAVRFAQVAIKYQMPVTEPDKQMMLRQCGG
ncbi:MULTISPECIES: HNH endonuclease family protein [unclassified Streptomyces]|uniref:HNH endonuclease family protein n=1 Tax=unclassified Streptomyces TaxID=2593676 RepID=UPI00336AC9BA